MSSAATAAPPEPTGPLAPTAGNCSAGGDHAPIPVQGKNHNVCAKCGATC